MFNTELKNMESQPRKPEIHFQMKQVTVSETIKIRFHLSALAQLANFLNFNRPF